MKNKLYPIWTTIRTSDVGGGILVSWVMGDTFPEENLKALQKNYIRKPISMDGAKVIGSRTG